MKTIKQLIKQHGTAVEKIAISTRLIVSATTIALYVFLIYTMEDCAVIGSIIATWSITYQITIDAWETEDIPWMFVFFAWYTILYASIASLFI